MVLIRKFDFTNTLPSRGINLVSLGKVPRDLSAAQIADPNLGSRGRRNTDLLEQE